jgi:aminoglycoside 6'-N-acetyltransferase
MNSAEAEITFRDLTEADLPLMHRWLATDHVAEWYPIDDVQKPPLDLVRTHYLPMIRHRQSTYGYVIMFGDAPIGFIQTYLVRDHPAYAQAVQVDEGTAGVDLFVGDEAAVHRGLGPRVLTCFLREVVFERMGASSCIIGPQPENRSAIRAYEKAGFRYLKTVRTPSSPGDGAEYLMRIEEQEMRSP